MQTCFAVFPLRCIAAVRGVVVNYHSLVTKTESNRYTLHLNSIRNAQWILSSGESVQTCFAVFLRSASLRGVGELQMSNCGCFSTCARCSVKKKSNKKDLVAVRGFEPPLLFVRPACITDNEVSHIYRCRHLRPCVGLSSHLCFLLLSLLVGLKSPW